MKKILEMDGKKRRDFGVCQSQNPINALEKRRSHVFWNDKAGAILERLSIERTVVCLVINAPFPNKPAFLELCSNLQHSKRRQIEEIVRVLEQVSNHQPIPPPSV